MTNNITKALAKIICTLFNFCICFCTIHAQQPAWPSVMSNTDSLQQSVLHDSMQQMVNLRSIIPALVIDLRYTTAANFTGQVLYHDAHTTFLRKPAATALYRVQQKLRRKGLALKIWDAYRPYTVTQKMWEIVPDERYAANPKYGSGHNRGAAVDLTLINIKTGKELDMGTGFDNFSDTAHLNFKGLTKKQKRNRKLLQAAMQAEGFIVLETEWWHFYLADAKKFPLLNISFSQLEQCCASK